MSISDVNPYIVTMPPVQGDLMDRLMRLSGRKKDKVPKGDSRGEARSEEDIDHTEESREYLDDRLKEFKEKMIEEMHVIANQEIDERMKIKPGNGADHTTVPSRSERLDAMDEVQRFRQEEARRRDAAEVEPDLIHKRPREGSRHKIKRSTPAYPGLDDLPWEKS
mgnify:CR=1 FL=1